MKNSCILLALAVALAVPVVAQAQQFRFTTNDGALTITAYLGPGGSVSIPSAINHLPVTSIGENAFAAANLTSVMIPASVTSIGEGAFAVCANLTSVYFRGSPPTADASIFASDTNTTVYYLYSAIGWSSPFAGRPAVLWNPLIIYAENSGAITITGYAGPGGAVTIPAIIDGLPVTSIGESAFDGVTSLTGVTLPESITTIGADAFDYCTNLASITIPGSVTNLGSYAFYDCYSLTSVTIPAGVTSIGIGPFGGCLSLTGISVDAQNSYFSAANGVLLDKSQTTLWQFPGGRGGARAIPDGVTRVEPAAFGGCSRLTSVAIPESVTSLGDYAFYGCDGLAAVVIPGGVTDIGIGSFAGCASLAGLTVAAQNTFFSAVNGVLFDKGQATLLQFPGGRNGSYPVPGGVTRIAPSAFDTCAGLTGVTIPGSVTNIGDYAFYATGLASITIPAGVTSIGEYAFSDCYDLLGAYFPGNAPTADSTAFVGDDNVSAYYLPGASGWGSVFAGVPAVLWNAHVQVGDSSFGFRNNQFGFNITGTPNIVVRVEASTDLAAPVWTPLQTVTLSSGPFYFSEPAQTNTTSRFYRVSLP